MRFTLPLKYIQTKANPDMYGGILSLFCSTSFVFN